MSGFNYDRYDRRQSSTKTRSALGFYVPLLLTVTVATAGLAAWVWSAREDSQDYSSDDDLSYGEDSSQEKRHGKAPLGEVRRDVTGLSQGITHDDDYNSNNNNNNNDNNNDNNSFLGRAQGVIRRTPSPQQLFDSVSKKTAAGLAAAGAAAGAALASIREEDKDEAFGDHNRWSEEAAIRRSVEAQSRDSAAAVDTQTKSFAASIKNGPQHTGKRRTVVLVVSAESLMDRDDDDHGAYRSENATILSHLPETDFQKTKLFILVYTPSLRSRPQSRANNSSPLGSSYSAISTPRTPGEELQSIDPRPEDMVYTPALSARSSDNILWNTLHAQALRLVENSAMVMPFATPAGYVHMLRHIAPELVYVVDALSGEQGRNIGDLKRWVGQIIVVVGADGTGLGGLVDTDDEGPAHKGKSTEHSVSKWWENADMVGLGKGVEIVDASRLADDYERRVGGRE